MVLGGTGRDLGVSRQHWGALGLYYEVLGSTGGALGGPADFKGHLSAASHPSSSLHGFGAGGRGGFFPSLLPGAHPGSPGATKRNSATPPKKKTKELVPKGRGWFRSGAIVHPQPRCRKVAAAALGPESSKLGFLPLHRGGSDGAGGKHPRCAPPVNWGR